jgi:hypothetical protein
LDLVETIYRMLQRGTSLEALPYEELHRRFSHNREAVFGEFVRRLRRLIFHCAEESCRIASGGDASPQLDEIQEKTIRAFTEFHPEFDQGDPETLLVRFAQAVRRVLGEDAFSVIALRFYYHLPLYHIPDDTQRRFLAALFENGLATRPGKEFAADLADRFQVSVGETKKILAKGQKRLRQIMDKDFSSDELRDYSEGYLPDYGKDEK